MLPSLRRWADPPPDITIAVDVAKQFGSCETLYNFSATVSDPDDGPPAVKWFSDLQGPLGAGNSFSRTLPPGTHRITATATDGIGLSTTSNEVVISAGGATTAARPTLTIISLVNHQKFAANQDVTLEAGGLDPNKALGGLVSSNVHWSSSKDGELGSGQRLPKRLSVGSHFIVARYTGVCGGTADDLRLIEITPALADAPPNMYITTPSKNDIVIRVDPDRERPVCGWQASDSMKRTRTSPQSISGRPIAVTCRLKHSPSIKIQQYVSRQSQTPRPRSTKFASEAETKKETLVSRPPCK